MRALPTGTVTFLFTDVEGSTRLLHEHGDTYAELLAGHRRALREAFARHGGVEVDTQGDAFFVAFARASDALAAATDGQAAVGAGPVRVRIGVHTGEPVVTDEGYVGIDVHRAARIAAAGHGGQVLVSQSTRELAGVAGLRDLGEHRLKDLSAPERLFQLGEASFPPLRTLNNSNLPLPPTPLIGRKKELAEVLRLFKRDGARLVTVTGPGGVGKTRFALEVARELVEDFAHGVWFVDLSPLRNPELVVSTVASVVGARRELGEDISDKELLLVLDNFEHVADAAGTVADVLSRCPNVRVLATSREPLVIRAERAYPLRPLAEAPAVELLRVRAEVADPDFDAPFGELAAIADRVDRLPLALELAAARLVAIAPAELLNRLERRLPLLTSRARDVPERQRTLRATIEWSYELLDEKEKRLFACLSVFVGGCTLDAAEAVCEADLDPLESLVAKNLVRHDDGRYSVLETVREYAEERLEVAGDARAVSREHAEYYAALGERAEPELYGRERQTRLVRLARDRENARSAFRWALRHDATTALRLATVAWVFQVPPPERSDWSQHAVDEAGRVETEAPLMAKALEAAGWSAIWAAEFTRAEAALERAAAAHGALRNKAGAGRALIGLARARAMAGSPAEAGAIYKEAIALLDEAGTSAELRRALMDFGDFSIGLRNYADAEELLERGRALAEADGALSDVANALHGLGDLALERGDGATAIARYRRSLDLVRISPSGATTAYCLAGIAAVTASRGDARRAQVLWRAVKTLEHELGFRITPVHQRRYEAYLKAPVEPSEPLPLEDVIELALSLD